MMALLTVYCSFMRISIAAMNIRILPFTMMYNKSVFWTFLLSVRAAHWRLTYIEKKWTNVLSYMVNHSIRSI